MVSLLKNRPFMPKNKVLSLVPFFFVSFFDLPEAHAQRVYQRGPNLMLEDAQGRLRSLGPGFNSIPISDHEFLLILGKQMGYGEETGCERPAKNRVVVYDTSTNKETVLFDKPIPVLPIRVHFSICIYEHADLSPSRSALYIVIPVYATSGCLAIIDLPTGRVRYVPGAMDVFVIRGGPNAGDLIYMRRLQSKPTKYDPVGHPYYPYIHARPDGSRIAIISDEDLVLDGGNAPAPILRNYLRGIHGRIFAQGEWVP
jgi:hypothetical protein